MKWIAATGLVSAFQCVFVVPVFERETHTPSGEFSAHSMVSQPKVASFRAGIGNIRRRQVKAFSRIALPETLRLVFSEELVGVFNEADENNDGGAGEAYKKQDLQKTHCDQADLQHDFDCSCDWRGFPSALVNSGACAVFPGGFWRQAV